MFQRSLAKIGSAANPFGPPTARLLIILALIAGAAHLRFAPVGSVLPYSDYIDEGYVLNPTIDHLNTRSYDCRWYGYPTLPSYLNTAMFQRFLAKIGSLANFSAVQWVGY